MGSSLPFVVVVFLATTPAFAADDYARPDSAMTPGEFDPSLDAVVLCNSDTKHRRHVTSSVRDQVFAAYNIVSGDRWRYELDHDVPLALGGTNRVSNLWPQPEDEAALKDVLEVAMQRLVCHGILSLAEAQREIADDWVTAYDRHVLHPR